MFTPSTVFLLPRLGKHLHFNSGTKRRQFVKHVLKFREVQKIRSRVGNENENVSFISLKVNLQRPEH